MKLLPITQDMITNGREIKVKLCIAPGVPVIMNIATNIYFRCMNRWKVCYKFVIDCRGIFQILKTDKAQEPIESPRISQAISSRTPRIVQYS
jgi:hypothetical protein